VFCVAVCSAAHSTKTIKRVHSDGCREVAIGTTTNYDAFKPIQANALCNSCCHRKQIRCSRFMHWWSTNLTRDNKTRFGMHAFQFSKRSLHTWLLTWYRNSHIDCTRC
jgi:hypothetical protein